MRTLVCLIALVTLGGVAVAAADVWVDDDCSGPETGSTDEPYCTIQAAICELKDSGGGTVHVAAGYYNESLRMFPGISVVSTDGPEVTTIDATGRLCTSAQCEMVDPDLANRCAVVVWGHGSSNSDRLEGFRLTGGSGLKRTFGDGKEAQVGAGVFVFDSSPTITNNVVADNALFSKTTHDFWGGGIYLGGGSYTDPTYPLITHNVIEGNSATPTPGDVNTIVVGSEAAGGGIYVGLYTAPTIQNNVIRDNVAGAALTEWGVGGGIASYAIALGRRPQISGNVIRNNSSSDHGGGVFFGRVIDVDTDVPTRASLDGNLIELNRSGAGGGVLTNMTLVEMRNNTVVDNVAEVGGGIALFSSAVVDPTLVDNVIAYNIATVYSGGGIAFYTSPDVVTGNDVFGNTPDQFGGDQIDADYIDIAGNISIAPNFASRIPGNRDLSPGPGSPLIDRGQPAAITLFDLLGTPRALDGDGDGIATPDLGAIEFAPDVDADDVADFRDNCPDASNSSQSDIDADGTGDACDSCPTTPDPQQANYDGDSLGDACDPDDDNDGIGDVQDCADHATGISSLPGSVGASLRFVGSELLEWKRSPHATVYNVYRGLLAPGGGFEWTMTCTAAQLTSPWSDDLDVPTRGRVFFYVVAARNVCGTGPLRDDSDDSRPFAASICAIGMRDSDGDGISDLSDNCPLDAGVDPHDFDNDGLGNRCDPCPWGDRADGGCAERPSGAHTRTEPDDDRRDGTDVNRD